MKTAKALFQHLVDDDDGGYRGAASYVTSIGAAIATIPSPYTIGAGVALQIIGGLIGLASWLDDEDHYGDAYKLWASNAALEAGMGSYILSYYEVDEGWFDDGHDFDLTINLMSAELPNEERFDLAETNLLKHDITC
jgi:hypothetical protein